MDKSKPSIPLDELSRRPAPNWKSAVVDAPPADLAKSDKLLAQELRRHSDKSELCRNAAQGRASKTVRTRVFQYLPLCVFLLAACGPTGSRLPADAITFDTSKGLNDFEFATAGNGKSGKWSIIENDAGRVLAQLDIDPADNRSPLAIYRPFSARNVYVSIRFMTISGEADQAAGVFVRFASVSEYYVARASALENNVGLYRVVAGKQQMIGCMEVNVSGKAWHTLGIAARDERLTVFFDGRELFVATDRRYQGLPGKVGLWTKADSVTWFESLKIGSLD
jgi:hypothetical protein